MKNETHYLGEPFMAIMKEGQARIERETVFDYIAPEDQSIAGYVLCGFTTQSIAEIFKTTSREMDRRLQHIFKVADSTTSTLQFIADAYGPVRWPQLDAVFKNHGLSLQEGIILQMTLNGKDTSQIRELTGIQTRTIQDSKSAIMEKLRLSSMNEAFAFVHTYQVPDSPALSLAA